MATFETSMKRAILSLWVAGIGIGALFLTVGAEFLAIIQWIISTMVAISLIFFSVMFGEYHAILKDASFAKARTTPRLLVILALLLGAAFATVILIGAVSVPERSLDLVAQVVDLGTLGQKLTQEHLLALEVLALTLFLVLVGGGVIARVEEGDL
jgi:NADH:ubiquinone oxidoreductase subunit 6 (subunit J)